ncbi:beta-glucosidase [Granulicella aggregans]|uniref:Beta-glucosidase n=1 Tax=Granulicella aggregans TaxID=474949 RepID=A0A7W8E4K4_9BACT|nr:beta-glucosidase BglX [Granulicella aggregans]MBB5059163.1 beta-glucosidase [Granulicella aggregans]
MRRISVCLIAAMSGVLFGGTALAQGPTSAKDNERANALLKQMTTEEKVGQLNQPFFFPVPVPGMKTDTVSYEDRVRRGEVGSFLFLTDPKKINELQKIALTETRLHIPILFGFDVIHGFDTEWPVPIATAASWDPAQAEAGQAMAAEEAGHAGLRWSFAPMLDIARDPRWGRISEGAGEDPYLGAAMARAQVFGFQGRPGSPRPFMATIKHFAGYGAAEGGRDYDAAYISEEELQNVYLPPFRAGVEAGAGTVMSAYMDLNDVPAAGNIHLLHDLLREQMGFKGFVVSDAFAVGSLVTQGFAKDRLDAAGRGAAAGVNMDMGSGTYLENLKKLVDAGKVSQAQLDELVRPILAAKYHLGLFEHPYADATDGTHVEMLAKHRAAERTAAARTAVLLRNEGGVLPLSKSVKKVAVIGPLGNSGADMNGPWSLTAKGEDSVSVYAGIKAKLQSADVEFAEGVQIAKAFPSSFDGLFGAKLETPWSGDEAASEMKKALDLASSSDVVVMTLGELAGMDFEYSSRSSLMLPGKQQELLEKIQAMGKPVVLLLFSTRPLDLQWASEHIPAIMDCYFGGTEAGNAVADLLVGDAVPGGKLPVSWPRAAGQIPVYYAHTESHKPYDSKEFTSRYWDVETSPLYPFGYGLSYSTFTISDLKLSAKSSPVNGAIKATAMITNTGAVAADEVVQLYIHQKYGSASRPVRELKGFERVTLKPGEKREVTFTIGHDERNYWSAAKNGWVVEPSEFDVWVGDSSAATLHDSFIVAE